MSATVEFVTGCIAITLATAFAYGLCVVLEEMPGLVQAVARVLQ